MERTGRRRNGRATVADVARAAGVSPMTVSRVVNGGAGVRPATREAVTAAVAALDYRPDPAARSLAGAARVRVALLYANPSAAYLSAFLVGSLAADAELVVERCDVDEPAAAVAARVVAHRVDGVVLPPPLSDDAALRALLEDAGLAVALVATGAPPADSTAVTIDDCAAAAEMTRHLLDSGHRRIGFIAGDPRQTASARRVEGFRDALAGVGMAPDPALIFAGDFTWRSGLEAAERLLALTPRPTAIFASNDDMAAAALAVAHRHGLEVPRDLSVVGFDDTAIATTVWPELTTIRQPVADMAEAAVRLVVAATRAKRAGETVAPIHRLFDHALVRRGSAAPPA